MGRYIVVIVLILNWYPMPPLCGLRTLKLSSVHTNNEGLPSINLTPVRCMLLLFIALSFGLFCQTRLVIYMHGSVKSSNNQNEIDL